MNTGNDNFDRFKNPSPYGHAGAQPPTKLDVPYAMEPSAASNGWGLAGFITSLVGLLICGVPSLIGVILSLIGISKKPKGFAIAGLIIGLVGLVELGLFVALTVSAVRQVQTAAESIASTFDITMAGSEIQAKWRKTSKVPSQEEGDKIISGKNDRFGRQLIYEPKEDSFSIRSLGKDGINGTADDISIPFNNFESIDAWDQDPEMEDSGDDWSRPPGAESFERRMKRVELPGETTDDDPISDNN